jgi:opacity protein-like surface antigen
MTKIFKTAVLAVTTALGLSSTAHAGLFDFDPAPGGAYASGFVGISFPSDADFEGTQAPAAGVPGAVGVRLPFKYWKYFQPRIELEISRSESDVSAGNFNGGNQNFSGDQSVTYYLINNSSDIIWRENQKIVPYFGGGIGIGDFDTNIQYFPNNGIATAPTFAVQNSGSGFATVSTLGATFKATDRFDIYAEGRYLKTYGVDAERRFIAGTNNGFSADVDDDPDGFTLTVGTRVNF